MARKGIIMAVIRAGLSTAVSTVISTLTKLRQEDYSLRPAWTKKEEVKEGRLE